MAEELKSKKGLFAIFGIIGVLAISVILSISVFSITTKRQDSPKLDQAVPVTVTKATEKTVPVQLRAIGNVEAYASISVKARVGGELMGVHFQEGQEVNKGDLLFSIDPRPFEVAVQEAKAKLARDTALAEKARRDLLRYEDLAKKGYVSSEKYDEIRFNTQALNATVEADKAAVETARLQLGYCSIYAPITGRTGALLVDQGNLIKANDDMALVVISQIQPIYVNFSVPEQYLPEIKKYMSLGELKVQTLAPDDEGQPVEGTLTFIDNEVDTSTGAIRLKGTFANQEKRLWPGQFVDVVLNITERPNAVLVPSQAVQAGQKGRYIFVVKPDLTTEQRPVIVGSELDGESVIEKGILPGEKVVTDGQLRLYPGAKVKITELPQSHQGSVK